MPDDEGDPADKARQGDIVPRRKWQRLFIIAGLVGMALFTLGFLPGVDR